MIRFCGLDEFNKDSSLKGDFNFLIARKVMNPTLLRTFTHLPQVAPSEDLLNFALSGKSKNINWQEEYTKRYIDEMKSPIALATIDILLKAIKSGKQVTCVCYCGKDEFCHRRLLADIIQTYIK